MKTQTTSPGRVSPKRPPAQPGGRRIIIFTLTAFVFGLVCGGYWYFRPTKSTASPEIEPPGTLVLSEATKAILQRLDSPVEIKLYSPSVPSTLPVSLGAFTARVQLLLTEYERMGDGKIRLHQSDPTTDLAAKTAAGSDGVLPFAGNNGEICYLGITVAQSGRKATIAQLSPDWEAALESDLSRAIARVTASVTTPSAPVAQAGASPSAIDPAISEELVRTIPNLDGRSYEEAAKILREAALVEFTAAVREMQTKVQAAQKELAAPGNQSEADQPAALKQLQQIQAEQSQKLSEITSRLQARITVLGRLKGVNRTTPK